MSNDPSKSGNNNATHLARQDLRARIDRIRSLGLALSNPLGIHTPTRMHAGGFQYTGNGDTARCDACRFEVSNWTSDMDPFITHSQQAPHCPFVRSKMTSSLSNLPSSSSSSSRILQQNELTSDGQERPTKRLKIETADTSTSTLVEIDLLQQVRRRTFSHWPHRTILSSTQMIEAGFFHCNVGDRVICLYCNIICQQWTPDTDDPCLVHKTLSPNCLYVKAKLIRPSASSILIVNENTTITTSNNQLLTSADLDPLRSKEIDFTAACNPAYAELPKRHASFWTWSNENSPPVDDLVRAGFFYTGTKNIVTCFYCNGSLQNWGPNDNPMIEHARWFPNCAYAKELCGDELHRKIQESKRVQHERARVNEMKDKAGQLIIPDESTLSRLVAARLDLPISQRLLDENFKLSIIKRCWEDQLRLKRDDFVSDTDLLIACVILQKQIEHIDGKKENIIIPNVRMKQIRAQEEAERKRMSFPEEKEKTMKREKSFHRWPHLSPAPDALFIAGWYYDETKSRDYTKCPYCDAEYKNWQSTDNPWTIHEQLSPFCPFLHTTCPMSTSSVCVKALDEIFTKDKVNNEITKSTSHVISTSTSPYALPPKREQSFLGFPSECQSNIDALVSSGFYYTGFDTTIRCYDCRGAVNDFHRYPSNEINTKHRSQFPHCHFAQLLPKPSETTTTNRSDLCKWCLVNPKEMVIYSCMHFVVCGSCTQWINLCPICGIEGKAFMKLFN